MDGQLYNGMASIWRVGCILFAHHISLVRSCKKSTQRRRLTNKNKQYKKTMQNMYGFFVFIPTYYFQYPYIYADWNFYCIMFGNMNFSLWRVLFARPYKHTFISTKVPQNALKCVWCNISNILSMQIKSFHSCCCLM